MTAALVLVVAALLLARGRSLVTSVRLARAGSPSAADAPAWQLLLGRELRPGDVPRLGAATAGAVGAWVLLRGPLGLVGVPVAAAAGVGLARWLATLEPAGAQRRRLDIGAALPLALDLVAACVESGLPVDAAVALVARDLDGPLGAELRLVAAERALGAPPRTAWARLLDPAVADRCTRGAARGVIRAADDGSRVAGALTDLARTAREDAAARAVEAARRAGVWLVVPLGLCFLPGFVLLGVVPLVAVAARGIWG